jgi:hypothetical protein
VDETWGDLGRMIGKGALRVAGHAVADGLGIKVQSGTLSRIIKAVGKKKKKHEVSKVGTFKPHFDVSPNTPHGHGTDSD